MERTVSIAVEEIDPAQRALSVMRDCTLKLKKEPHAASLKAEWTLACRGALRTPPATRQGAFDLLRIAAGEATALDVEIDEIAAAVRNCVKALV